MNALELLQRLSKTVPASDSTESLHAYPGSPSSQGLTLLARLAEQSEDRKPAAPEVDTVPAGPLEALAQMQQSTAARDVRTEAQRILAIPTWSMDDVKDIDLTEEFRVPGGTMQLKPIQSLALYWMRESGGLLGAMAVGVGKTLVSLLAPLALGSRSPLLLVPPAMQVPLRREIKKYGEHFRMPKNLMILPYSMLSQATNTDLLGGDRPDALFPDLIIADEAHSLRYLDSARSKRVFRYLSRYPTTKFVALSGTLTSRGLADYAHLAEAALGDNCPLPVQARELLAWAACIDAGADPRRQDIDLFSEFCDIRGIHNERLARETARETFRARLISTPGVVATRRGSVEASLILTRRHVDVPREVSDAIADLNATWTRPDGEELVTALDRWRVAKQLVQGFYYYWDWPDEIVDTEWMNARSFWHREVRRIVQMDVEGLDSMLLVRNAVSAGVLNDPQAQAAWYGWELVKDRPQPPTKARWISEYLIEDVVEWLKEHPKGLVWYDERTVMERLRRAGIETYEGGEDPPEDGRAMALSVPSHGVGRNLQANSDNLILSFTSSGKTAEQLLGRTHRYGQLADEVHAHFYAPTVDTQRAVEKACRDARYIEQTQGSPQKLCYATWIGRDWDGS